jgi:hypothetical protein
VAGTVKFSRDKPAMYHRRFSISSSANRDSSDCENLMKVRSDRALFWGTDVFGVIVILEGALVGPALDSVVLDGPVFGVAVRGVAIFGAAVWNVVDSLLSESTAAPSPQSLSE